MIYRIEYGVGSGFGEYQICVRVYNVETNELVSDHIGSGDIPSNATHASMLREARDVALSYADEYPPIIPPAHKTHLDNLMRDRIRRGENMFTELRQYMEKCNG
jgi:hypothetical protein